MIAGSPLKRLASISAGQSPPSTDEHAFIGEGLPFLQGNAGFGQEHPTPIYRCDSSTKRSNQGDILISVRAPVGALNTSDRSYGIGRGLAAVQPGPDLHTRFCWWWLHSVVEKLRAVATGSTYEAVTAHDIGALRIGPVDIQMQRKIADFLDDQTVSIDALIDKKHQLQRVLEVRWQTLVRSLALGSGWPLVPLRRLWEITDCKHRTPNYVAIGFPVVSPGDVTAGRLDLRRCDRFVKEVDLEDLTERGRRPRRGDILYSRNASIGIAAYVDNDERFTMGQDVCLIRSYTEDQLWLSFMLNSVGIDQLAEMKIGSTFDRVNIAQLKDLLIPLPPHDAQKAEARRLDEERRRVDQLHSSIARQLTLLRERRQALITAAVTGELDIPGLLDGRRRDPAADR